MQCGSALLAQCKGIALFFVSSITNYYTVCAIVARERIRFATFDGHPNVHWIVAHVFIPVTCCQKLVVPLLVCFLAHMPYYFEGCLPGKLTTLRLLAFLPTEVRNDLKSAKN